MQHDSFKLFVQPTVDEFGKFGDGTDVEMMLLEENKFTTMLDSIGERMASAFENAEVGAQKLRPFLSVFLFWFIFIYRLLLNDNYLVKLYKYSTKKFYIKIIYGF